MSSPKNFSPRLVQTCTLLACVVLGSLASTGCAAPFKISDSPDGFVQVSDDDWGARYKALDNVGMRVDAFENYEGGTLDYWGKDLVNKLAMRGYTKTGEGKTKSGNGEEGAVYHFDYSPPGQKDAEGQDALKFYTVVLFVTDKHRVVIEFAGDIAYAREYRANIDAVARTFKIR